MWKMLGKILFFGGAVTSVGNLLLFSDRPTWADNVIVVTGMMCIGGFNLWVFAGALSTGSKKAKNGPLVIGVLDALKRGASVNDEPQIKFTVRFHTLPGPAQDSQEVTGSYKRVVSERTAQRLAPGDLVPVRYNLDNPRDFMIDFDAPDAARQRALAQRARGLTCEDVTVRTARLQEVRFLGPVTAHGLRVARTGVKASGVVVTSRPTGTIVDGAAQIELQMTVTRPDDTMFDVTTATLVDNDSVPRTTPGTVLRVMYTRGDEQDVVVAFPEARSWRRRLFDVAVGRNTP